MALTAKFVADFSDFQKAVDQSIVKLRSFEVDANKVGKSLNRVADSLSGRRTIQEAKLMASAVDQIGGVSKLTGDELQRLGRQAAEAAAKMKAMGIEVPPGIQKIADAAKAAETSTGGWTTALNVMKGALGALGIGVSVAAVVNFGREVLAAGDSIQKMADQTGLSTTEVQKFQYVAGQSGSSIESLIGATQKLQQSLGDDSTGAAAAMKRLGINADAFAKLNTYQQMTTLSDAIRKIEDPTEQASTAAALFGKTWKEILPAIKNGMKEVGDQAPIMSDATVKALDAAGDAMTRAKAQAIEWGGEVVVALEKAGFAVGDFFSRFTNEGGKSNSELLELAEGIQNGLGPAMAKAIAGAEKMRAGLTNLAPPKLPADLKAIEDGLTETAKASIEFNETLEEMNSVGASWQKTLDSIDGSVVEAVKHYLDAGLSAEKLAKAYGLTDAQVKAVSKSMDEDRAATTRAKEAHDALAAAVTRVQNSQRTLEQRMLGVSGAVRQQAENFLSLGNSASDVAKVLHLTDDQVKAIQESMAKGVATTKAWGDAVSDEAERAAKMVHTLTGELISAEEARKRLNAGNSTEIDTTTPEGRSKIDPAILVWLKAGYSLAQASAIAYAMAWKIPINQNDPLFQTKGPRVPGFADGVENFRGGMAMVGERGPELVTLPKGSSVFKNGTAPSGFRDVNINMTVHAQGVLDRPALYDMTRQIKGQIVEDLKAIGYRPSLAVRR